MTLRLFALILTLSLFPSSLTAVAEETKYSQSTITVPKEGASQSQERIGEIDEFPELLKYAPIVYPESARKNEVEGTVALKLHVDETGKVDSVRVLSSKPELADFEKVAIAAVKSWEFKPAKRKGISVPSWVAQTIRFKLAPGKK